MATKIQIKRSTTTAKPSFLSPGELAYSEASDKLYIGVDGAGIDTIGGKDFTDTVTDLTTNMHNYLPAATASQFGAIKIGTGLSIDGSGVVSATGGSAQGLTESEVDARVQLGVDSIVAGAPAALNTLNELAEALNDDANAVTSLTSQVSGKMSKSQNLADLTNATTARSNLGLNNMALQSASSVSITGGSIDGVTLDGGTF
ncbi:hypothetical protein [Endozoicomonas sp. GU-1]|uniref:hypothetical protein n=1 Tax=Endozoicomonas sp. GU-1 TaxID=3009078 RepID=UPI0022B550D6|nr:hypothetical protein [Endozoicomonas sp. GU-1]WBA81546.1 hypothetical protein O2T12_25300 [Endozoicomonas sp. GU-1]WBA84499.1 hypothetical protein O3276_14480 [Endozoicomonas sp. GU-1]